MDTRERLCKMGILQHVQAICPMCQQEVESVEHLFCGCSIAWRFWSECFSWWEIKWCSPLKPIAFFQAWNDLLFYGLERKLWKALFYVVIWSIWNIRNRIVFEFAKPSWDLEIHQIKLRWGYWVKSWIQDKRLFADKVCLNPCTLKKWRHVWRYVKG